MVEATTAAAAAEEERWRRQRRLRWCWRQRATLGCETSGSACTCGRRRGGRCSRSHISSSSTPRMAAGRRAPTRARRSACGRWRARPRRQRHHGAVDGVRRQRVGGAAVQRRTGGARGGGGANARGRRGGGPGGQERLDAAVHRCAGGARRSPYLGPVQQSTIILVRSKAASSIKIISLYAYLRTKLI